jgi:hypothetical protein
VNRYVDLGLMSDMRSGKRILVTTPTTALSQHQFGRLEWHVDRNTKKILRSQQRWYIQDRSGGSITIRTLSGHALEQAGLRGMRFDVIMPQFIHSSNYYDGDTGYLLGCGLSEILAPDGEMIYE